MKRWRGFFTVAVLCFGLLSFATPTAAQDSPSDDSGDTPMTGILDDEEISTKLRGGLFVSAAFGSASADPLNTSIRSAEIYQTVSETEIDEQTFGRASIGWKLAEGKGAFRLSFNGYREDDYTFTSQGLSKRALDPSGGSAPLASALLSWWNLSIKDGQMVAVLSQPVFELTAYATDPLTGTLIMNPDGSCQPRLGPDGLPVQQGDDLNCNNIPDPNEVRYPSSEPPFVRSVPDNLENQLQTIDLTYGRQFGGRRYSSAWQAGLRYFEYEGQVMGGAWLWTDEFGGFSDGSLLRPLRLAQSADGIGPTGSWEVDFNFFNKGLVFFVKATTAFTFNNIEVDSGNFFTLVQDLGDLEWVVASARLKEKRDKSSWQNSGEFGARVHLRNGLELEVGYTINGFLDVVITPFDLTLPETTQQTVDGTSALFATQDYKVDSFHFGVGFQF